MDCPIEAQGAARTAYAYTGGRPFTPGRPTVVFVHGALNDHSVWTLLARWCAHHGHDVLAPDLPGHGRSAGPPLQSIEAMADWLLALIASAAAGKATLVGHSMGSLVALEAAARAPHLVDRLVLLGTAAPMTVSAALLDTARQEPLRAIDLVNGLSHSGLAGKPSYPGPGSWLHGGQRALMRRVQAGDATGNLFLTDFEVCNRYTGALEAARTVTCPATVIAGGRDRMTAPRQSAALAQALRARTIIVAAGHAMMAEAPDEVLVALRSALA